MSSPSLSPTPPESRGRGSKAVIIAAVTMALLIAALFPLLSSKPTPEPAPAPVATKVPTPAAHLAEPPPPPPEPEPEPAAVAAPAASEVKAADAPKSGPKKPKGCEVEECKGAATVEIHGALRAKAGQVRSCYERALAHNAGLQGKIEVDVRIAPSGEVCSTSIAKETLGDPAVLSCVLQRFRSGQFPKPSGGCIDTRVPINFVPPQL